MKVVILCGGYGTRIRDVSEHLPKPMIPIGRFPILWHIMNHYSSFGFNDFILCLGYKSERIKDFFLNYDTNVNDITVKLGSSGGIEFHRENVGVNWKVTLVETGIASMTGARVKAIESYINGDDFMLTYGDGLGNVDLKKLKLFHLAHGKTLTVTGVRPPGRFGELEESGDFVTKFNEKPQASGGRISGGFFVVSKRIFEYLNDDNNLVFEQNPMRTLAQERQLCMFRHDGFWQPMDTQRDYGLLNELYKTGNAPWVV
ncbi:glucose-1-phosphate cytidylyltransferase [Candidatus Puniceispirillum sp.]|nr:glucose-1-phosphate cytidylyltransferase [Candidatus Puniceispirillum sp.]